jgi:hypothetical protein
MEIMSKRIISNTLEKLRIGGDITNSDIIVTLKVLKPMVDLIDGLGDHYDLMTKELRKNIANLEEYKRTRKIGMAS